MSGRTGLIISVFLLAMGCTAAAGRTIYVDDDGPADFNNIQAAIDDSNDSDTIIVADGTYTGPGNRDIDFKGKAITLKSEDGPENCIVDCENAYRHRGFYFHSGEDTNSVVSGFTIKRGKARKGAGIFCSGSSPTIENCIISGNDAWSHSWEETYGGGMYFMSNSNPRIIKCTISHNNVYGGSGLDFGMSGVDGYGAGIFCSSDSHPTVENCIIISNECWGGYGFSGFGAGGYGGTAYGGGIYGSNITIKNCVIIDNTVSGGDGGNGSGGLGPGGYGGTAYGGGIYGSNMTVQNCVIADNTVSGGDGGDSPGGDWLGGDGGDAIGAGVYCDSAASIDNCSIVSNMAAEGSPGDPPGPPDDPFPPPPCPPTGLPGVSQGGGVKTSGTTEIANCIVWGNTAEDGLQIYGSGSVSYSDVQGGYPGDSNIDADPCFADANNGDYHLKSQGGRWEPSSKSWVQDDVTSPCIDGGDMASPIGYESFPNGGRVNMGAYGGTAEASKSYFGEPVCETIVAGDINGDCKVNFLDFRIMALHWLRDENQ